MKREYKSKLHTKTKKKEKIKRTRRMCPLKREKKAEWYTNHLFNSHAFRESFLGIQYLKLKLNRNADVKRKRLKLKVF